MQAERREWVSAILAVMPSMTKHAGFLEKRGEASPRVLVFLVFAVFPILLLSLLYMWRYVLPYVCICQMEAAPACMAVAWEAVMAACQVDVRVTPPNIPYPVRCAM